MKSIKVLITGAGAPGIKGTIYSLKNNFDNRKIEIIGTDIKDEVVGKYLCDKFYKIPKAADILNYLNAIINICEKESVDIILPQNTAELITLTSNKNKFKQIGTTILVSDKKSIEIANNKYNLMRMCDQLNIPVTKFHLVNNIDDLLIYSKELGWPYKKVVVKPPSSNGLRGVRIIDEHINLKELFYNEKPSGLFLRMEDLQNILGKNFPDLIIMEYLPGEEYTVDILRTNTNITVIPRKRDLIRSGITFNGTLEHNEKIIEFSIKLSKKIDLHYCFGFQFKLDGNCVPKILECNPRIQGTMVLSTLSGANIIYSSIKAILGEDIPDFNIKWGTKLFRYWGGISVYNNELVTNL